MLDLKGWDRPVVSKEWRVIVKEVEMMDEYGEIVDVREVAMLVPTSRLVDAADARYQTEKDNVRDAEDPASRAAAEVRAEEALAQRNSLRTGATRMARLIEPANMVNLDWLLTNSW